jgi:hypothetical protein
MSVSRTSGIPRIAQPARVALSSAPATKKTPAAPPPAAPPPTAPPPRISSTKAAPECQTIHRFVGATHQASDGMFGIGKRRDNTFEVVQCEVKLDKPRAKETSWWEVRVRPINKGRIDDDIHAFTSNRKVNFDDFNNPKSGLMDGLTKAVKRLNDKDNRLPEPPKPKTAPPPVHSFQVIRDTFGGAANGLVGAGGGVANIPERIAKDINYSINTTKAVANWVSGGRIAKRALNPLQIDDLRTKHDKPTNVEKGVKKVQNKINGSLGADENSLPYKVAEFATPIVATALLAKAPSGKPPPAGAPAPKLITPGQGTPVTPVKPVKVTRSGRPGITPVSRDISSQYKKIVFNQLSKGSVKLTQNGRPMTWTQVVEAVKKGQIPLNDLGRSGYSNADIQKVMREAANRNPPGAGQAAQTAKPEPGNTDPQPNKLNPAAQQQLLNPAAKQQLLNPAATRPLLEAAKPGAVQRGSLSQEQLNQLAKEVDVKAKLKGHGGSAPTLPILLNKISTGQQNQLLTVRDAAGKPTAAAAVGSDLIRTKQGDLFDGLKIDYLSNGKDPAAIQKLTAAAYRQAQAEGVPLIISPASEALASKVYVPKLNQLMNSGELGKAELLRLQTRDGDTFFVIRPRP